VEPHLKSRNITGNAARFVGDTSYPFFAETTVFGATIKKVDLGMQTVTLSNNHVVTVNDLMSELDRIT
jgi:hypothetical protein